MRNSPTSSYRKVNRNSTQDESSKDLLDINVIHEESLTPSPSGYSLSGPFIRETELSSVAEKISPNTSSISTVSRNSLKKSGTLQNYRTNEDTPTLSNKDATQNNNKEGILDNEDILLDLENGVPLQSDKDEIPRLTSIVGRGSSKTRVTVVGIIDLIFGLIFVTAAITGTVFDFSPIEDVDLQHNIFLIYGGYGIFLLVFGLIGLIAVYNHNAPLIKIFLFWKQIQIPISVIIPGIVICLLQLKVLAPLSFCRQQSNCLLTTTLIVGGVGLLNFGITVLSVFWIISYLKLARSWKTDSRSTLLHERRYSLGNVDVIDESFIPAPQLGVKVPHSPNRSGAIKFNHKPEQAIQYLINTNIIQDNPKDIANYLHTADNLNMGKIGEFISDPKPRNQQILKEYCNNFVFTGMDFDEAIRTFLSKFRLPGEAQKIDRIMEHFAIRYCECNPKGFFPNSDTAYVLAFAVIMLNTDAHNQAIKKKMSKREFIYNNRGIADGKDLPTEYLEKLYDNIIKHEIKFNNEELFVKAVKKGWLKKQGRNNRWQKHWFIVANNCMYYFKSEEDQDPKVIIPLEGLLVRENIEHKNRICFEIFHPAQQIIKSCKLTDAGPKEGHHERFVFETDSIEELESWIDATKQNIITNPILQLITQRKLKMEQQTNKRR